MLPSPCQRQSKFQMILAPACGSPLQSIFSSKGRPEVWPVRLFSGPTFDLPLFAAVAAWYAAGPE